MDVSYWNACRFQSVAVRFLYMLSFAVLTHSSVPRAVRKIGKPTKRSDADPSSRCHSQRLLSAAMLVHLYYGLGRK